MVNGTADIGLSSRALKEEETSSGLKGTTIALDGIAVIVNADSQVADLTVDQIAKIFTGEITNWSEVGGADGRSPASAGRPTLAPGTGLSPSPEPRTPASSARSSPPPAR